MKLTSELIPDYEDYLRHERKLVESTITSYRNDISALAKIAGDKPPRDYTLDDLRTYLRSLSEKGYARATIRRRIHGLSAWYDWLLLVGHVDEKLSVKLHIPKKQRIEARWLTEDELKRFVNTPSEPRLECAWGLLAWCGLRRSELLNMTWDNIRLDDKTITVRKGKGHKDRTIPIATELGNRINTFWVLQGKPVTGSVFGNWYIKRFMLDFRAHVANAGLKDVTPRTLRHTFITHLIRNGVDIDVVQRLAGHEHMTTTFQYAHQAPKLMQDAMKKFPI